MNFTLSAMIFFTFEESSFQRFWLSMHYNDFYLWFLELRTYWLNYINVILIWWPGCEIYISVEIWHKVYNPFVNLVSFNKKGWLFDSLDFKDNIFIDLISISVVFEEFCRDLILHLTERSVYLRKLITNGLIIVVIYPFKSYRSTKSG